MKQKYYKQKKIANADMCQQFGETVADHITSACPILAKEQYIKKT